MQQHFANRQLPIANLMVCNSQPSHVVDSATVVHLSLSLSLSIYIYIYICVCVGTRAQIYILGLKPYLVTWIRPRRNKRLDRLQNRVSHTEKVEEGSLRRLSFSNRVNVGQASSWAIQAVFQEVPMIEINFRHVQIG